MSNNKYAVKEILFGLRDECLRLQKVLKEIDDCLDYDRDKYEVNPYFSERNFENSYNLWFSSTKLESTAVKRLRKLFGLGRNISFTSASQFDYEKGTFLREGEFPVSIKKEMKDKMEYLTNYLANYDYLDVNAKRASSVINYYPQSINVIDIQVGNIFYRADNDRIYFNDLSNSPLTKNRIDDMLNQEYYKSAFSERTQEVIDQSSAAKKEIILKPEKFKGEECFSIVENQKTLILVRNKK